MSKHREPRINRRTTARMLRGAPVVVPGALAAVLAAAAAPPRDGELAGEREAVTAFLEAAHRATAPQPRSPSMIKSMLAKLLTVKAAAAAAALCTVGGVATAAVTGHLAVPSSHSSVTTSTSSHPAGASATLTATSAPHGSSAGHRGSPSPSLVGLCHAYTAGAGSDHGKALDNPAFTVLITTAGGKTKVDSYCTALLKEQSSASATGAPASPGRSATGQAASTDHPTGAPDTHPTGAPSTHPTGAPVTHPTGAPPNHNQP